MPQTNRSRREFLKSAGLGAAALPFVRSAHATRAASNKPNIIFIMADDLGSGDVGCYGQRLIETPHIDRMATRGARFTRCYAGAAVCAPSRSVLMTGLHTGHTRVRGNSPKVGGQLEAFGEGSRRLSLEDEDRTVAEVLREAGYATGITGKWGLGEPGTDGTPNRQGFDEWYGYLNQNHAPYYYTDFLWRNEEKDILEGNKDGGREQYSHDLLTDFALDFIRDNKDAPFFLYIPYTIPHRRFEVPSTEPYSDQPWPEDAKIYAAMISRMDRDVGRILGSLEEHNIENNTLVVFTSDNGAERGKKKGWNDLFQSNGSLRGSKGDLYEGGIRVPAIVQWPGRVATGEINDTPWYFADVLPTLADLANVPPPPNIDGTSVLSMFIGEKWDLEDRFMYWEAPGSRIRQAVRWRNWKAHRKGLDGPLELYDLSADPAEKDNVAENHTDIVATIEGYLKTARKESPHWPSK